jgi:hypothetical protein
VGNDLASASHEFRVMTIDHSYEMTVESGNDDHSQRMMNVRKAVLAQSSLPGHHQFTDHGTDESIRTVRTGHFAMGSWKLGV